MKIQTKIQIITEKFNVGRNGQIEFLPYEHQQQNVPTELNFCVIFRLIISNFYII